MGKGIDDSRFKPKNKVSSQKREILIHNRHIASSLETTRASVPPDERKRLERIYYEFENGRDGSYPSGAPSNEIGGRTSLM